jgi:hypothetical protein
MEVYGVKVHLATSCRILSLLMVDGMLSLYGTDVGFMILEF